MGLISRAGDIFYALRFLRLLTKSWDEMDAFKYGIIDDNGKVLRKAKTLKSAKEKDSYTILHRFVFNLKRLLGLLPGGKTKFASYATALALLIKENKDINAVELERGLYKHLIENDLIAYDDDLKESVGFDFLPTGRFIMIDRLEDLEGNKTADVGAQPKVYSL